MQGRRKWVILALLPFLAFGLAWGQTVPQAPDLPECSWEPEGTRSNCRFQHRTSGLPTSVAGNRVIVFRRSATGGHFDSRNYLDQAVTRLAARYGFAATFTEDPAIFTPENLANTKVVIMSHGDGDVIPPGRYRTSLEDFQQVHGWGVIWIHAACAFLTNGWPFAQNNCVQQFYKHNASGTVRRMFIDSGTAASPHHGRRHPDTEFLLRDLPGWEGNRSPPMADQWYCFRQPARNTQGVKVLFGYDHGSGLPMQGCPEATDSSEAASQNHNMAWTRMMGRGIALVNSWGHDQAMYTGYGGFYDTLLWRSIRYAAKDWCTTGGPGPSACSYGPPPPPPVVSVRLPAGVPEALPLQGNGRVSLPLAGIGRCRVTVTDIEGRRVYAGSGDGPGNLDLVGLRRGLHLVRVVGAGQAGMRRVLVF